MDTLPGKLNIGHKLFVITMISIAGMFMSLLLFHHEVVLSLTKIKKNQQQNLSDAGLGIIKHFYKLTINGELKEPEAKTMVFNILESITFGNHGYYWITSKDGILLMHPYMPELIGSNTLNSNGMPEDKLFHDYTKAAKNFDGLIEYHWPKPGNNKTPYSKISYIGHFKPWNWILGTGIYVDDMEKEINEYVFHAMGVVFICIILIVFFSMSVTKKYMKQLESMATRDTLTSLYTRRYLNERMENLALRHNRYQDKFLSIIFFDIDFFKKINDSYGHSCGDEVLSSIGNIIIKKSRPDDLCIRYGGEEFVVILLSKNKETAISIAERIRSASNKTVFQNKGVKFSITLSAGIAIRENNELLESTLNRADKNLYKAKELGRDCIIT